MSLRSSSPDHDPLTAPSESERDRRVQAMFGRIARRYDLLNGLLSLGIDRLWRRQLVTAVAAARPGRILDVATGTADLALALKRRLPDAEVLGVDFAEEMLDVGRRKVARSGLEVNLRWGDGMDLPFPDASFDVVTIAYGLRNFSDRERGLTEFHRVLRPGGRLAILEFPPPPAGPIGRLYRLYFRRVVPWLGGLISGERSAYRYLPASVETFPSPEELTATLRGCGFRHVVCRRQTFGISALHIGDRPS